MYWKWKKRTFFGTSREIFSLRLIATGESGILLSSYLLWTTATQNHGRICKFVPLLTAMYLKEEKIPISSCFSEKIFKIFRSTLLPKESIPFCQLCSQKRWFSEFQRKNFKLFQIILHSSLSSCFLKDSWIVFDREDEKKHKKIPSTRKYQVRGGAVFAIYFLSRNAELPSRFFKRIFLDVLYSSPMNPNRSRKHRNAYFSFSTVRSFAVIRLLFFAISTRAVISCV